MPEATLTRRALLKAGGTAGVALTTSGTAFASVRRRRIKMRSHLRRSSYRQLVGQRFGVQGGPGKLRLIAVRDLNRIQKDSDNAFALIFRAPSGAAELPHPTAELHHSALGSFGLFMTPGPAERGGQTYCAVINRLRA